MIHGRASPRVFCSCMPRSSRRAQRGATARWPASAARLWTAEEAAPGRAARYRSQRPCAGRGASSTPGGTMAGTEQQLAADAANEEAIAAWDGPLFERFLRFQHLIVGSFARHGETAIELLEPQPGERVIDIGCGFGDTTERLAALVAPSGSALGVDAAPRFIEHAREAARRSGLANAQF